MAVRPAKTLRSSNAKPYQPSPFASLITSLVESGWPELLEVVTLLAEVEKGGESF